VLHFIRANLGRFRYHIYIFSPSLLFHMKLMEHRMDLFYFSIKRTQRERSYRHMESRCPGFTGAHKFADRKVPKSYDVRRTLVAPRFLRFLCMSCLCVSLKSYDIIYPTHETICMLYIWWIHWGWRWSWQLHDSGHSRSIGYVQSNWKQRRRRRRRREGRGGIKEKIFLGEKIRRENVEC